MNDQTEGVRIVFGFIFLVILAILFFKAKVEEARANPEDPHYSGPQGRRLRRLEQEAAAKAQELQILGLTEELNVVRKPRPTPRQTLDSTIQHLEEAKRRIRREIADPEVQAWALNYVEHQIRDALKTFTDSGRM